MIKLRIEEQDCEVVDVECGIAVICNGDMDSEENRHQGILMETIEEFS